MEMTYRSQSQMRMVKLQITLLGIDFLLFCLEKEKTDCVRQVHVSVFVSSDLVRTTLLVENISRETLSL